MNFMVAIKAAHRKLTAKDLWLGLPWTWEDTSRIQDECRQRVIDSGETNEMKIRFAAAGEWEQYIQSFPRYGEQQQILKSIYPAKKTIGIQLSEEELQYLHDKLYGVNDPIGATIFEKIQLTLSTK